MDFQFWPAVVAGLAGGAVMSLLMAMMRKAGKTEMDMVLLQGTMPTCDRASSRGLRDREHRGGNYRGPSRDRNTTVAGDCPDVSIP